MSGEQMAPHIVDKAVFKRKLRGQLLPRSERIGLNCGEEIDSDML